MPDSDTPVAEGKGKGFAKLFGEGDDQVVAIRDVEPGGPLSEDRHGVRFYYVPAFEGLTVSHMFYDFSSDQAADEAFASVDEEVVARVVHRANKKIAEQMPELKRKDRSIITPPDHVQVAGG